jgi:lipopolysaccharide/colanic/teichoic acid biosynthesis glycosyltransferase
LWNVLKAEMSLVKPRPLIMLCLPLYSPDQDLKHEVRASITDWAQVSGCNAMSWEDKFNLDVWSVDNRSIWLNIKILWFAVKKVVLRDGISVAGEATMPAFAGSRALY